MNIDNKEESDKTNQVIYPIYTKDYLKDLLAEGFIDHFNQAINCTIPHYPMMMYCFIYALGLRHILEIGVAQGWTSYYLARAAHHNGGHFYGIDIDESYCQMVRDGLDSKKLPHTIVSADTKDLEKLDFIPQLDFAFLDGEHSTEAVLHEVEMIYPLLGENGTGFIFIHDIIDAGNSDAWWKLKNDSRFEGIGMNANYGLGILRKMKGMDYEELAKKYGRVKSGGKMGYEQDE